MTPHRFQLHVVESGSAPAERDRCKQCQEAANRRFWFAGSPVKVPLGEGKQVKLVPGPDPRFRSAAPGMSISSP